MGCPSSIDPTEVLTCCVPCKWQNPNTIGSMVGQISCSLNFLKGAYVGGDRGLMGIIMGIIKGDTGSLDYSSPVFGQNYSLEACTEESQGAYLIHP